MATKADLEKIIEEKDTLVSDVIGEKAKLEQTIKDLERKVRDAVSEANEVGKTCAVYEARIERVRESINTVLATKYPEATPADPYIYIDPNAPKAPKVEELLMYQYLLTIVS